MATDDGKLEVEMELKCSADKTWQNIRESPKLFPKALPEDYKKIEILQGDGHAVGSVRVIHFGEASPIVKVSTEKIDAIDDAKRRVMYSVIDGDLMKYYKKYVCHLSVEGKGEGSLLKWGCEYEKINPDSGIPPHLIKEAAISSFKGLDAYVFNNKA